MKDSKDSYVLQPIPLEQAEKYAHYRDALIEEVNKRLLGRPDFPKLIGNSTIETMIANHRNHADFMATVFRFNSFSLLEKTLPWVYRAYHNQGFSYDYFLVELYTWVDAIKELIPPPVDHILSIYRWMIEQHENNISLSQEPAPEWVPEEPNWRNLFTQFFDALLAGDVVRCLDLANASIHDEDSMLNFFTYVLQPSMSNIGVRWENGIITVAQEHLASAIVARVLSSIMVTRFTPKKEKTGKAVVSAAPNEFHEIGAWMVALTLESDGWDVRYLGANTPRKELVDFVRKEKADLLCISVAMPFNLIWLERIVKDVKSDPNLKHVKVIIGGQAVLNDPSVVDIIGADAFGLDCRDAKLIAKKLIQ